MWSHYADHHRGFCVGFRFWPTNNNYFQYARKVEYQEELPKPQLYEDTEEFVKKVFLIKSKQWEYEWLTVRIAS